jgi:integrase/recombinase XerC
VGARRAFGDGSTNRTAAADLAAVGAGYLAWLAGQPLARRSRETYAQQVGWFLDWLASEGGPGAVALGDPVTRDHAARDYKAHLKAVRGLRPSSVNLALAGIDHLYRYLGHPPAAVRREELPQVAPRALSREEQKRLLRTAEGCTARDRAIVVTLLFTGLRLGELAALSLPDVAVSARKGMVVVRRGKGDAYREVDLNREARRVMGDWLRERAKRLPDGEEPAVFVSRTGGRLSARSIDEVVRGVGRRAGIALSAHVLRHTCLTGLVRAGNDLVLVAEVAGHLRLETTRRYSRPSASDRRAAMEGLAIEY